MWVASCINLRKERTLYHTLLTTDGNSNCVATNWYSKVIWLYQLSWKCKLATVTSYKADVSSVSFITRYGGQFTFQLSWYNQITLLPPPTQYHSFFRNFHPWYSKDLFTGTELTLYIHHSCGERQWNPDIRSQTGHKNLAALKGFLK